MITLEEAKKSMDNEINKAKRLLDSGKESARWLEATPEHSFGKEEHMVKIFVLEGTPPKGYILADYTNGIVKSFSKVDLKSIKTFRAYKKGRRLKIIN